MGGGGQPGISGILRAVRGGYYIALRFLVMAMACVSGVSVVAMMCITMTDIVMRAFGSALTGSYDLVRIGSAMAIAFALPYTTAVKGHVAVEYFFQKLNRPGRIIVDSATRLLVIILLAVLVRQCIVYGNALRSTGQVSLTLQLPMYWVAYVIGGALGVTILVKIHNLLHPGREMIRP